LWLFITVGLVARSFIVAITGLVLTYIKFENRISLQNNGSLHTISLYNNLALNPDNGVESSMTNGLTTASLRNPSFRRERPEIITLVSAATLSLKTPSSSIFIPAVSKTNGYILCRY
jgi:hypothetical protein